MSTRRLLSRFLLLRPHKSTFSRSSLASIDHVYFPWTSEVVHATPGCPKVLQTSVKTPGAITIGIADLVPSPLGTENTLVGQHVLPSPPASLPLPAASYGVIVTPATATVLSAVDSSC